MGIVQSLVQNISYDTAIINPLIAKSNLGLANITAARAVKLTTITPIVKKQIVEVTSICLGDAVSINNFLIRNLAQLNGNSCNIILNGIYSGIYPANLLGQIQGVLSTIILGLGISNTALTNSYIYLAKARAAVVAANALATASGKAVTAKRTAFTSSLTQLKTAATTVSTNLTAIKLKYALMNSSISKINNT